MYTVYHGIHIYIYIYICLLARTPAGSPEMTSGGVVSDTSRKHKATEAMINQQRQ